jgi:hypothetical protein
MRWEEFNALINENYPWSIKTHDYSIMCPALDVSFDNGGNCRQCRKPTILVMSDPSWGKGKPNPIFRITYDLLRPKPRICCRECLFNYINDNSYKILERITA